MTPQAVAIVQGVLWFVSEVVRVGAVVVLVAMAWPDFGWFAVGVGALAVPMFRVEVTP